MLRSPKKKKPSRKRSGSRGWKKVGRSQLKAITDGGGAGFALVFFVCISLAAAAAAVIEVRNYIEYPCVQQFRGSRGNVTLTLFHRGTGRRHAAVFIEEDGMVDEPRFVTRLFYVEEDGERGSATERFEDLAWSRDGSAVFATRSESSTSPTPSTLPEILWLYDFDSGVFYKVADSAIPGRGAEASQLVLQRYLFDRKEGPGEVIARWFELGKKDNYAFSWQTTRWTRAVESAGEAF